MTWKKAVLKSIEKQTGKPVELLSDVSVGGGSINDTFHFETNVGDYFVKKNIASRYPKMFEKEALGLKILAGAREIQVPDVVSIGEEENVAFLILNFIISSEKKEDFWDAFAKRLAKLHKHTNELFGLDHDNYIGSLQQSNNYHDSWTDFFREERLAVQVKIARDNGSIGRPVVQGFERFYNKLNEIFPVESPALIHGDLWSGNFMVNEKGEAILIDPAVYYGHREMDLAMSQLFGGFDRQFYESYHQYHPLEKGWQQRLDFCNLYPLMVHVNLFGENYLHSVKSLLSKF